VPAHVYNYTVREGSLEEKEEEAWTSFCQARNFRPQPGTSGPRNFRPQPETSGPRNFRPLPGTSGPATPAGPPRRANSLLSPDPGRTLPGTSGHRTFRPSPDLPALPARIDLGRGPCTPSPPRLYILFFHLRFRVSKYDSSFVCELCSYLLLLRERDHSHGVQDLHVRRSYGISRPPSWEGSSRSSRPRLLSGSG
jgi:hypothetical protein